MPPAQAESATPARPLKSRATYGLVGLLAVFPLHWVTIGGLTPHNVAAVIAVALAVGSAPRSDRRWYWRSIRTFAIVTTVFASVLALITWYWAESPIDALRTGGYALIALLVARPLAIVTREPTTNARHLRILVWACPLALGTYLYFFYRSMVAAGISLTGAIATIQSGNPDLIETNLFRAAFNESTTIASTDPSLISSNVRHESTAALFLSALVTLWALCLFRPSRLVRLVGTAACVGVLAVITLSLSRALLVGLVVPAVLLVACRVAYRGSGSRRVWLFLGGVGAVLVVTVLTPLAQLVYNRFVFDTESYEIRSESFSGALTQLGSSWSSFVAGGELLTGTESSHNMVIDAWSIAGLAGGVAAIAVVAVLAWTWLHEAVRFVAAPVADPIRLLALMAGALPIARAFSAGGGLLHFTEWMLAATFFALITGLRGRGSDARLPERGNEFRALAAVN